MSDELIRSMLEWHIVNVETYLGETSEGPKWKTSIMVPCTVSETGTFTQGSGTEEESSNGTISCTVERAGFFTEQSRVTLPSGRVATVRTTAVNLGGAGPIQGQDQAVITFA